MRIIIIGAGISGLTASLKLSNHHEVLVLEKEEDIGGLARSIHYAGYTWDLGPHRFYTDDEEVLDFIKKLISVHCCRRLSSIYMYGDYHSYPIQFQSVRKLGWLICAKCISSYLWARLKGLREGNLEDWIVSRFGRELYSLYFYEYTKKIWGLEPEMISSAWSEKRIPVPAPRELINSILFKKDTTNILDREFIYPSRGKGIQEICNAMRDYIYKNGGRVNVKEEVIGVGYSNDKWEVKTNCATYYSDYLISSLPLSRLPYVLLGAPQSVKRSADKLRYRSLVCLFLVLDRDKVSNDHWIYFSQDNIPYMRFSEPKNFDSELGFDGKTHLCVEFACFHNDSTWNSDASTILKKFLETGSLVGINDTPIAYFTKKIEYAYPIYEIGYHKYVLDILRYLDGLPIIQIGRNGTFFYGNMADSVEEGFHCANKINALV